ncbi:MAG: hypothetical protein PHX64_05920 [Candidatus Omnitrophica bacterium]|nr:hypothetical protein [Candidatus Omnitrophota bacterium]MDD5311271.1 hypothetical protein [Candidatus Omnitrophota bacterium]MDD5546837.1 hypothetical protein [Candidatus Omnitrophota bacterium]
MTDSQLFQLMGVVYTAAGLGMLINPDYYKKIVDSFDNNPALIYITSLIMIVAGFVLVTFHNVWVAGWPVIITIVGYAILIKAVGILLFPRELMKFSKELTKKVKNIRLYAVIPLAIGLGLMYLGFVRP